MVGETEKLVYQLWKWLTPTQQYSHPIAASCSSITADIHWKISQDSH